MAAKTGDTVRVHYTGTKAANGEVFDSSQGREPLEFKIGEHHVIPDFEEGIIGLNVGEKKTINASCERAYGTYRNDMVFDFEKSKFPKDMVINAGDHLYLMDQNGNPIPVKVLELGDKTVKLDANHSLAGEDLIFEIELVEII